MSDTADKYLESNKRLFALRLGSGFSKGEENLILGEMDDLWRKMTDGEQDEARSKVTRWVSMRLYKQVGG